MNCHSQIFSNAPFLEPVRASFNSNTPLHWTRVHDLPDFVYFDHSIHINKGVGCTTCHGQVDRMPLMWQANSLQMHGVSTAIAIPNATCGRVRRSSAWTTSSHRRREPVTVGGTTFTDQFELGKAAGRRISDSEAHELLDVSPMKTGKAFWRTLDELADDPSFVERLHNEFPSQVEAITDPTTRRTFMKLMGASLALAGVTACTTQPEEAIVPYVRQPEDLIPGKPDVLTRRP